MDRHLATIKLHNGLSRLQDAGTVLLKSVDRPRNMSVRERTESTPLQEILPKTILVT